MAYFSHPLLMSQAFNFSSLKLKYVFAFDCVQKVMAGKLLPTLSESMSPMDVPLGTL